MGHSFQNDSPGSRFNPGQDTHFIFFAGAPLRPRDCFLGRTGSAVGLVPVGSDSELKLSACGRSSLRCCLSPEPMESLPAETELSHCSSAFSMSSSLDSPLPFGWFGKLILL